MSIPTYDSRTNDAVGAFFRPDLLYGTTMVLGVTLIACASGAVAIVTAAIATGVSVVVGTLLLHGQHGRATP